MMPMVVVGLLALLSYSRSDAPLRSLQLGLDLRLSSGLRVFNTHHGGRGLTTDEVIPAGVDFLSIPLSNCFSVVDGEAGKWPLDLAIKLKREMLKSDSKWSSYLQMLPTQQFLLDSLPHHWTSAELEVFERDADIDTEWSYDPQLILDAIGKSREIRRSFVYDATASYALDLVQTRNLGYKGAHAYYHVVVPGLDLCNHDDCVNSAFRIDETTEMLHLQYSMDLSAGSEVCLNYRFDSQERCFSSYGFVPDVVKKFALLLPRSFTREALMQSIQGNPEIMQLFDSLGISINSPFELTVGSIMDEKSPLHIAMRVFSSSRSEIEAYCDTPSDNFVGDKERANLLLKNILQGKRNAIRDLLDQDNNDIIATGKGVKVRNKLLQNNFDFLEKMIMCISPF